MTLYRPLGGEELHEVRVWDEGHVSRPWVMFVDESVPEQGPLARASRAELVGLLRKRWPDMLEVPVLPHGGLPNWGNLRTTDRGYLIAAEAATNYELTPDSPLLAPAVASAAGPRRDPGKVAHCLNGAGITDLASSSRARLEELRRHYSHCQFDSSVTSLIVEELVRRGDPAALFDTAIKAYLRGDKSGARHYLGRSADKGYVRAKEGLDYLAHGGDP